MIKSCEPLRQQLLRYFPQLFFLHMINVVVRQLFPTIACIKLSADSGHCLIQQEADGSGSPFLRRADKGAEKDIRQRVKPLVHSDDVGRNNAGIGGIDSDSFFTEAFRKFDRKQHQSQFCIAVNRDSPKTSLSSLPEEIGKIEVSDRIRARNHVYNTGSACQCRKEFPGKQVRPQIVHTCDPTPLYRLNTPEVRDKEFEWLKEIGIQGVKIDFFGGDSIGTMNYYIDLLEDAARHKLLVNFHGAAIPRGWQRTYPNLMSVEAVYGAEWYNNKPTLTDNAAWHNCTLPFTRNVIGPMDYTPCTFTNSQHPHITTDAHELALLVIFESALQHLADRPEGYRQQPVEVQNFIRYLPVAWEDTRLLSGYPAESVVIARKSKDSWYISGLNGTENTKSFRVNLEFIKDSIQLIQLFSDTTDGKQIKIENSAFDTKELNIECQPRGGFVVWVKLRK